MHTKAPENSSTKTYRTQNPPDLFFCRHSVTPSFFPSFHIFFWLFRFLHCLHFIRFCIYTAQGRAKNTYSGTQDIEWERAILDFYSQGRPFFLQSREELEKGREKKGTEKRALFSLSNATPFTFFCSHRKCHFSSALPPPSPTRKFGMCLLSLPPSALTSYPSRLPPPFLSPL